MLSNPEEMKPLLHSDNLIILIMIAMINIGCNQPVKDKGMQHQNNSPMILINKETYGTVKGQEVFLFTLENSNGMVVKLTNYGGIVTSVMVPDKQGNSRDVVLGFDSLQGYLEGHPYFGCIVGRYANRIAKGYFELEGNGYQLARNNGENHLHGGMEGLDKKVWQASEHPSEKEAGVRLEYLSPDGEENYPGNLKVTVVYSLTEDNELKITYTATTDQPTPVNLTHHGYFNLNGQGEGDILGHRLFIDADRYTAVNEHLIPTGILPEVEGTPMDFRLPKLIGKDFSQVAGGYDHNYVLNKGDEFMVAARLESPESGITMEVLTTQPGMQFYSGNFLDGTLTGKKGKVYHQHYGLCLETQHFPDSPNQPGFPGTILEPGETFSQKTIYKFGVIN